jgi:ABC-type branched-subunit amino acid transport system substrate-binding protein
LRRLVKSPLAAACLVLALMLGAVACGGGTQRAGGRKKLHLVIGDILPLSGDQQALGAPGQKAADLAIKQIKTAIVKAKADHTIAIRHENDRSQPDTAADLAGSLIRSGATCLVGPWSSQNIIPLATKFTVPKKILEITPAASADSLTRLEAGGYLNRTVPPDRLQGLGLAKVMSSELGGAKGKSVSIASFKNIYGRSVASTFAGAWKKLGGKVGAIVTYEANLPDYKKQAKEMTAGKPDAFLIVDFQDNYIKMAPDLVRTRKWKPGKTFVSDSLAVPTLAFQGRDITEGVRGIAPGAPDTTPLGRAFGRLYEGAAGPKNRQTYDAQEFDAVVLCYLSAVAAGSTSGRSMAKWVRKVSAPPGKKYTWQQLPDAISALEAGSDIDYEGASGPIDMTPKIGDPTAGVYDLFRFRKSVLEVYGEILVPGGKAVAKITPQPQHPFPVATTGPTGASGASGATGRSGNKSKTKKKKRRARR